MATQPTERPVTPLRQRMLDDMAMRAMRSRTQHGALGVWKTRFGGDLVTAYPQAISALAGLEQHLPRMSKYVARARRLAERLRSVPGLIVNPPVPQVNAFQLLLPRRPDSLVERNLATAHRDRIWLFNAFLDAPIVGRTMTEVVIGAAADAWTDDEAVAWIEELARV